MANNSSPTLFVPLSSSLPLINGWRKWLHLKWKYRVNTNEWWRCNASTWYNTFPSIARQCSFDWGTSHADRWDEKCYTNEMALQESWYNFPIYSSAAICHGKSKHLPPAMRAVSSIIQMIHYGCIVLSLIKGTVFFKLRNSDDGHMTVRMRLMMMVLYSMI